MRETLKPQHAGERHTRRDSLIELKAHGMRTIRGLDVKFQHSIEMLLRRGLIADDMESGAEHALAYPCIGRFVGAHRQRTKISRQRQCFARLSAIGSVDPERPKAA